ncbi:unnamed protein product, partial [Gadus morhua 'NCC']
FGSEYMKGETGSGSGKPSSPPSFEKERSEFYMGMLRRIRSEFIQKVSDPFIKGLLVDLTDHKVFSTEEEDSVMKEKSRADVARRLIDMVLGKGERASLMMINSMKKRDPHLCSTLGLIYSPAVAELGWIGSELIDWLSDDDVIDLLYNLRKMDVLNDQEKKTVEGKMTSKDRARCLIDTVMEKGERESRLVVDYLKEEHPELRSTLDLSPTSARIKHGSIGSGLIELFSEDDVIGPLHYLRKMDVLKDGEKKTVQGKMTSEDKARCLIDTVMEKGERESSLMVDYLTERHPDLYWNLGLTPPSTWIRFGRSLKSFSRKERPGLMSPSLPLEMHEGDSELELGRIRSELIDRLSDEDVIDLLYYLRMMDVLNDQEMKTVEGKMTSKDRARCLIDTVMEKGERASSLMVDYLKEWHPDLCWTLGLTPTSAWIKLGRIHTELIDRLSDDDVIGPLYYLRMMDVLNDEEMKTVEEKMTSKDRARCLIDTVLGKGERASSLMVDYLTGRHPDLCSALGLTPTSARIRFCRSQESFSRKERPGLMSPSLPLKMHEGDSELELGWIRSELIDRLSDDDVIAVLHYLRMKDVLNDEEMKTVEGKMTSEDRARCLIDTVMEKGERGSRLMVDYLKEWHPDLYWNLGLTPPSAWIRYGRSQESFSRKERPGLMSPSRPLKMHEGDSELDRDSKTRSAGRDLSDEQLLMVAQTLGHRWKQAAFNLGLGSKDLDDIKAKHRRGALRRYKMLGLWRRRRPPGEATAQDLLRGLEDLEDLPVETRQLLTDIGRRRIFKIESFLPADSGSESSGSESMSESELSVGGRMLARDKKARSAGQDLSDKHLMKVAETLGQEWEQAAIHLELKEEDLDDIKEDNKAVLMQRWNMLQLWKDRRPTGSATAQDLLKGLEDLPVETRQLLTELGRIQLIYRLSEDNFIVLLYNLRKMNVLNDEETKAVEKKSTREDKARCLVDTVMEKKATASSLMVDYLKERHPELCSTLGLAPTSALHKLRMNLSGSKLVDVLSAHDVTDLTDLPYYLRKMNVLKDEEKKTVEEKKTLDGKTINEVRARCLIDTVMKKGERACILMVDYLTERHPVLCSTLTPTSVWI